MGEQVQQKFKTWAVIELFGHSQIVGEVSEQSIGGCSFIRVDVPELNDQVAYTKFYGNGAIYAMTPVSEEIARHALECITPKPINQYYLPVPQSDSIPRKVYTQLCSLLANIIDIFPENVPVEILEDARILLEENP